MQVYRSFMLFLINRHVDLEIDLCVCVYIHAWKALHAVPLVITHINAPDSEVSKNSQND